MKRTIKFNLIRSLVVLGSCLGLCQVAQAAPKFHGTLTMNFNGMVMYGGMGPDLGDASMLMLMMGGDTVTHSDGNFAALRVRSGDAVNGPMMIMQGMSMGAEVTIPSVDWSWMESDMGPSFSSTGPNNLHITLTGMTMGGGYAPTTATLTLDLFIDENGIIQNVLTLNAEPPGQTIAD